MEAEHVSQLITNRTLSRLALGDSCDGREHGARERHDVTSHARSATASAPGVSRSVATAVAHSATVFIAILAALFGLGAAGAGGAARGES